ncbi:MAG TPA: MarR family transcriptional regulator [Flavobacteriales bacterium]|nr:MarR family transcriptional regulator [Flavobacteriales bacterium]
MARIEEEIKQKKFENEFHKLTINVMFTASWFQARHLQIFKPHGISGQQYNILRILKGQLPNPAPLKLLTERMIDKMSNTSRLVEKLVKKGLVERTICEGNRRQVDIIITQKGLDLLKEVTKKLDMEQSRLTSLTEKEAKQLNNLLDQLRN